MKQGAYFVVSGELAHKCTQQKKQQTKVCCSLKFRESAGARTRDPNIKSVVLYLLSYGFNVPNRSISVFGGANVDNIFIIAKFILRLLHFCSIGCGRVSVQEPRP